MAAPPPAPPAPTAPPSDADAPFAASTTSAGSDESAPSAASGPSGPALPDEALDPAIRAAFDPATRRWGREVLGCDPAWAVDYFARFFHRPLARHLDLGTASAIECASGTGFNAIAYVLAGGRAVVGYDLTSARVDIANELARRLRLGDRARFEVRDIHALPPERAEVAFTLQTLEHVPRPIAALRALADRASRALLLSTPNHLFPRDGHDTGLMFAHWLPPRARRAYAELRDARRADLNRFMTPFQIARTLPDFALASRAYNFASLSEWLDQYPCFFPYGAGGGRWLGARRHRLRWRLAASAFAALGAGARLMAPVIEGIYLRRHQYQPGQPI